MGTDVVPIDDLQVSPGRLTLNVHLPPTPNVYGHEDDEGQYNQIGMSWGAPDETFFRRQVNHPDPAVDSLHTASCENEVAYPWAADEVKEVNGPPAHPEYVLMVHSRSVPFARC